MIIIEKMELEEKTIRDTVYLDDIPIGMTRGYKEKTVTIVLVIENNKDLDRIKRVMHDLQGAPQDPCASCPVASAEASAPAKAGASLPPAAGTPG